MSFYSSISRFYDDIFPFDAEEAAFVVRHLDACTRDGGRVLDIGCGTGNKTVHMAGTNRFITAVDGDPSMIAEACSRHAHPRIEYRTLNMTAVRETFGTACFEAVLCLGNTLVHLPEQRAVAEMVESMHSVLKPGGLLVVQILNYDRIPTTGTYFLPLLETDRLRFERRYEFHGEEMRFITELTEKETGVRIANAVPLCHLGRQELDAMLARAGFREAEYYGSYLGDPSTPDSFPLIVTARKA